MKDQVLFADFTKLDIRVGQIVETLPFPEARIPSFKLKIDFGPEIGIKNSSSHLTEIYSAEQLTNQLVLCVVNFAPKQVGKFKSEVLVLGVPDQAGKVILVQPERSTPLGSQLF